MLYKYRAFVIRCFSSWQTIFPYAPKFSHITPILRALHWFMTNERIEYKLLSLTYKVLTTSPAEYLVSSLKISSFVELVRESLNGTTPSNQLNIYLRFWVVINFWTSRQWKGVTSEDRKKWTTSREENVYQHVKFHCDTWLETHRWTMLRSELALVTHRSGIWINECWCYCPFRKSDSNAGSVACLNSLKCCQQKIFI